MSFVIKSKTFLSLAIPMIVSNVFVPLAGLVDTAIVGHLPGTHHLAGVALGSVILTQVIWVCGFLRMSSTGLSAQAKGKNDLIRMADVLRNGAIFATMLGITLALLQSPLFDIAVSLSATDGDAKHVAATYFNIRINFIVIPLLNLVLSGWMLGQQWHKKVMCIQICSSVINLVLSYVLAIEFSLGVAGVAIATVVSECLIFAMCTVLIVQHSASFRGELKRWNKPTEFRSLLSLNRDMFLRNITLQLCLAMITFLGLRLGDVTAATNAILMQFFVLIALGLDGIAYSVEALIGEASGQAKNNKTNQIISWVTTSLIWSNLFAITYSLVFFTGFSQIASLMTDIETLQINMQNYKWYIVLLPVVAHWCFTFDGIYIGLMRADIMRNTMIFSALWAFAPMLIMPGELSNHVIWSCFLGFLFLRGITLLAHFTYSNTKRDDSDIT